MRADDHDTGGQGGELARAIGKVRSVTGGFAADIQAATREMRAMDGEARRLSRSIGSSLRSAFDKAVFGGGKLTDVLRGLARDVAGKALGSALRPVSSAVGSGIGGVASGVVGGIAKALAFGQGDAFSGGRPRGFADGGIVQGATMFATRSGPAVMGEAGPEAIMPLARGADGRLGVQAQGRTAGTPGVTVHIHTPDIEGFRRSRGQVAAQIARAVGRGQGRL